jgi:hypothetical protein
VKVAKDDRFAIMFRQSEHSLSKRFYRLAARKIAERIACGYQRFRHALSVLFVIDLHMILIAAQSSQHLIARYAVQISRERPARRIILIRIGYQPDEDFLSHVFGHCRASAHLKRESVNRALPPTVERRKCVFISGCDQPKKFFIIQLRQ